MGVLGKRKMNNILSRETGVPYKDVAIYGRYFKVGSEERLIIGSYELRHSVYDDSLKIYEPDFTEEEPKYKKREVELKGRDAECTSSHFGAE